MTVFIMYTSHGKKEIQPFTTVNPDDIIEDEEKEE